MDFNLSDLQRMLLESAERYLSDRFTLEHRRTIRDHENGFDAAAWATFAELGWLSILIPENMGGLGGSLIDAAVLAMALGSRCLVEPFASSAVLGATILAGAQTGQDDLLGMVAAGTARLALAHEEPGRSHVAQREVNFTVDGAGFALSGQKVMVLDAPVATHLLVSARGPDGLALLLLPASAEGIAIDGYPLIDGSRAADVRFAGVRLDRSAILAQGENAKALLDLALDRTRIILAAQSVGSMEAELEICSAYLKDRQQFGQPIGRFQALQHIMADMFVATHQARSMLYHGLSLADADAADRARAVALARLNIGEAAQLVTRQAIQLHGGYGVTDEYEVSHHYRRQLVLEKQYGDLDHALQQARQA